MARPGTELAATHDPDDADLEVGTPAAGARRSPGLPAAGEVGRHDEVGLHQPAPGRDEPAEQPDAGGERRVGNDAERTAWQSQVGGVGADDAHAPVGEPLPEGREPARVQLDGDHPRTGGEERRGDDTAAGADVEDEVAGSDSGVSDQPPRVARVEAVPSPEPRRFRGHGGP